MRGSSRTVAWWTFLCLATCLGLPAASGGTPGTALDKVEDRVLRDLLASAGGDTPIRFIASTRGDPAAPAARARLHFGRPNRLFPSARAFAGQLSASELGELLGDDDVASLSLDWKLVPTLAYAVPAAGADGAADRHGLTGAGVTVAVVDSGVRAHDDLGAPLFGRKTDRSGFRVLAEVDWVGDGAPSFSDPHGHGTHVAGVIAGSGEYARQVGSSAAFAGVAPGASLVSLRVLDGDGRANASDVIGALDWVLRNRQAYGIRVVNVSLGHPVSESFRTDPLCRAVDAAWRSGVVVVASAGNFGREGTGYGRVTSPGSCPSAITVGATNTLATRPVEDDLIASYSSRGPTAIDLLAKPDLVAAGNRVVSLRSPDSTLDRRLGANRVAPPGRKAAEAAYFQLSGTSMAAPMVAGATALLLEREPGLKPADVKARLMAGARRLPGYDAFTVGTGHLDLEGALARSGTVAGPAASPRVLPLATGAWVVTPLEERDPTRSGPSPWGRDNALAWPWETVWGQPQLLGPAPLWPDETTGGDTVLWGDHFLYGD
jgi:serine protease AprX